MPLFATLVGSLATAFASLFSTFMGFKVALKLAAYTAWLLIFTTFLASVYVCVSALYAGMGALISGGGGTGWVAYFFMGVGMFIPANAGAVVACVGSVWIATGIYKFQKDAVLNFGS